MLLSLPQNLIIYGDDGASPSTEVSKRMFIPWQLSVLARFGKLSESA